MPSHSPAPNAISPAGRGRTRALAGREADRALARLAADQGGVCSRRQLLAAGLAPGSIDRRIATGLLVPLHAGVYAVGHRHVGIAARRRAALLAAGPSAVLSHRSAARPHGLLRGDESTIELTSRHGARRPGLRVHRGTVAADERELIDGLAVTTVARTLVDLAGVVPEVVVRRAWERARSAAHGVPIAEVLARHRSAPGVHLLRAWHAQGERNATRSGLEDRALGLLEQHGFPPLRVNEPFELEPGAWVELDLAWPEVEVVVEVDGPHHLEPAQALADKRRDRALAARGWLTVRITEDDLARPQALVAELRAIRAARGARA